jgi:hypothetical protein
MMRRHASALAPFALVPSALILGLALLVAACGSSSNDAGSNDAGDSASPTNVPATSAVVAPSSSAPAGQIGSIGDAVEVAAGAPAQANDAACVADRQTLEAAAEMYLTLNGVEPASQNDLLDAGLIKELSPRFEITPDGVLVPAPGSPCT